MKISLDNHWAILAFYFFQPAHDSAFNEISTSFLRK